MQNQNNPFKVIKCIKLRYADPICTMDLTDKSLLYGTMIGTAAYYNINQDKYVSLSDSREEHISGVKLNDNNFYICIGDEKIYDYQNDTENFNEPKNYTLTNNYNSDEEHNQCCDNCFTMLKDHFLVRTLIDFPTEPKTPVNISDRRYIITDLRTKQVVYDDKISMGNYCVPFDFDGQSYIFVDFLNDDIRTFNIYNVIGKNLELKFDMDKKFGHISLCKILKNQTLFVVRDYNVCEIRNKEFKLINVFNAKGNEIIAFDVFYENEEDFDDYKIVIMDLNCNVILYDNKQKQEKLLFNLENMPDIEKIIKDQRFFSMGYPYYIKMSKNYFAISSDYVCLLIQHPPNL